LIYLLYLQTILIKGGGVKCFESSIIASTRNIWYYGRSGGKSGGQRNTGG